MPLYHRTCEHCQKPFTAKRAGTRKPPRFCSYECYWASGSPAGNIPRKPKRNPRRRQVYLGRIDGRPIYENEARFVWNLNNPDDPVGPDEHIHHIDGDFENNDPSNLQKLNPSEHESAHAAAISSSERSRRMRKHHARNPGRQRTGEPKTCPACGVEFYRPPSAKAQTCSYRCMGRLRSMRKRG